MSLTKTHILEPILEAQGYGNHVGYVPHSKQEIKAAQERHTHTLHMRNMDTNNQSINTHLKPTKNG